MAALSYPWRTAPVPADSGRGDGADPLAALVVRIRAGDLLAFEALYRKTRDQVQAVLYRLVGSNSEMDDLVQQVYLQLLSAIRGFRGEAKFSTFLHRVCANVALMHLRTRRRRPEEPTAELPEQSADGRSDPERAAQIQQAAAMMQKVLDRMTPKKRVVFVYHELMGMGPEEIALAVDTSANTVRSRLHHARLEFTQVMARLQQEPGVWAQERRRMLAGGGGDGEA